MLRGTYPADMVDPSREPLGFRPVTQPGTLTAMGWNVDASGLLVRLRADYGEVPIWIAENGAAFEDPPPEDGVVEDPQRLRYLQDHLQAVGEAVDAGVDVRRYFAWSLLDNFEWEQGYDMRFGIVHVDYATQRRVVKRSGLWYRDLIAARRRP